MAGIIDGKAIAKSIKAEVKAGAEAFRAKTGRAPKLAVILVGENPASMVYVKNKEKACAQSGIDAETYRLSADTPESELLELIAKLNSDNTVNGILVQLPLPKGLDERKAISAISPEKDVDGLTNINAGRLTEGTARLTACTPSGCIELLTRSGVALEGKDAVIIGRSRLVGIPLMHMLTAKNCTVTLCHSKTNDLKAHTLRADIVVCAAGRPGLVTGDMIKPGAVVIDVGINRMPDGSLKGDADFESAAEVASLITPVPGGVGPMTIAMLVKNTLTAAEDMYG